MGVRGNYIGGIVGNGLVIHLDAGKIESYNKISNNWNDLSVNTNNSTLNGGYTFSSPNGGSLQFNGVNSYVACGLAQSVGADPSLSFSVSVWVKKNASNGAYQSVVERYQGITIANKFGWYIALDMNNIGNYGVGDLSVLMNNSQQGDSIITSTASSILNQWKNVVFTYDGTNGFLYVDGNLQNSKAKPTGAMSANSRNLNIGYQSVSPGQYLNGNVAHLLLYNRTITASEVLQNFNALKSRFVSRGIDSDAQLFLTAALINDAQQSNAVNNLVLDLKKFGLWSKMRAIYPVVGGNAWSHAVNLKTPGTFNLTFFGTWTHGSTGMTGSTGYANTSITSDTVQTTNHLSFYSRTQTVGTEVEMGTYDGSPSNFLQIRAAANYVSGNVANVLSFTTTGNALGFWLGTKRSNTDRKAFRNGVSEATNTTSDASALPNIPIYLGARNSINYSPPGAQLFSSKQCAFASIGDGLTDTESANFYTAVQAFQTLLGRQV